MNFEQYLEGQLTPRIYYQELTSRGRSRRLVVLHGMATRPNVMPNTQLTAETKVDSRELGMRLRLSGRPLITLLLPLNPSHVLYLTGPSPTPFRHNQNTVVCHTRQLLPRLRVMRHSLQLQTLHSKIKTRSLL